MALKDFILFLSLFHLLVNPIAADFFTYSVAILSISTLLKPSRSPGGN